MDHICFTMRVDPAHLERYERMHREAWPELLTALGDAGWRNYGLFLRADGFLIGHLEADDWPTARAAMDAAEVSPRWSAEMDQLVVPGTRMRWLRLLASSTDGRSAVFADDDGTVVAYTEHSGGATAFAGSMLAEPDPQPFRRVFDLEHQLAALPR